LVLFAVVFVAGSAGASIHSSTGFDPNRTEYTGIDPGTGEFYTYAPSVVQINSTTRDMLYCGNATSTVVRDHIMFTVGHLRGGHWEYSTPRVVFGPENDPQPHGFFSYHACEPEMLEGTYRFAGGHYSWVLFFTAESAPSNSTNQIGVAFANSPAGPWHPDLNPLVTTADDYGHNSYPNDCPIYPGTGQTFYCLGQPAATSIGGGHILLAYTGNAGSPGNVSKPAPGVVLRELNLSNVPAGPCTTCFVTLPTGSLEEPLTQSGLPYYTQNAALALDTATRDFVLTYDAGPEDPDTFGPPVTPVVTVATMSEQGLLSGKGQWQVVGNIGQCLSGYVYNDNSAIVRNASGDVASGNHLEVMYSVADNNLGNLWGVWGYRIWDASAPLLAGGQGTNTYGAAAATCQGLDLVSSTGSVVTAGSAKVFSPQSRPASGQTVGMVLTPDRQGYYEVTSAGHVSAFGDAASHGSAKMTSAVGIALDDATGGYWVADANGAVSGFAAPRLSGSPPTGGPVTAMAGIPNGTGYYLVTSSGKVRAYGHAKYFGSMTVPAGQSVTAMAVTPTGLGYYLVTSGGDLAGYGDAQVFGPSALESTSPVTAMAVSPTGTGYWVATKAGTVTGYGDVSPDLTQIAVPGPAAALVAS
jgi:hypothetical protein